MTMFTKSTVTMMLASVLGGAQGRPNIIIMQPDDFPFMDEWTAPPNNALNPTENRAVDNGGKGLQHINRLRVDGVEMMQAYSASPVCGTSRYSTITGKMPSRASTVAEQADANSSDPATVTIPTTKLTNPDNNLQCSNNLAMAFANEPVAEADKYRTGMFGKWHLSDIDDGDYTYENGVEIVKKCGFDTVGALYVENLAGILDDFGHNIEFITYEAINFIKDATENGQNFFMYFNPTVPHSSGDVMLSLTNNNCHDDHPNEDYDWTGKSLSIPGMVGDGDGDCRIYRDDLLERCANNDDDCGKIWVDDSVGALLNALRDAGQLENTIFLFQEDHGMDTKNGLYEGGIRIPQFVHYPVGIKPSEFHGLVSTIDIAATMLDYAGIAKPYDMDGKSWKDAMIEPDATNPTDPAKVTDFEERCLFFENEKDRVVRCGCYKYIDIFDIDSKTYANGGREGKWGLANDVGGMLFDLCGGTGTYITAADNTQEANTVSNPSKERELITALQCHVENTAPQPAANPNDPAIPNDVFDICTTDADRVCRDSTLNIHFQSLEPDTCENLLKENSNRCSRRSFMSHCRGSCDNCDRCLDSRATFEHPNGSGATTCESITDAECDAYPKMALYTCPGKCGGC